MVLTTNERQAWNQKIRLQIPNLSHTRLGSCFSHFLSLNFFVSEMQIVSLASLHRIAVGWTLRKAL
jgi:hypothetical protein